ncbi:MAG: ABC transporter ATP-binding protein [Anaerolineales bacterium]
MLELKNISKSYERKPLLKDISFLVRQGETVCLLGASGSGKSTLLKMIAGLESPESGTMLFNQIDLAQTPPHLRDFGLVFQDYGLFPHLNIFDNVAFGLKMKNFPVNEIRERVTSLLEQVGLIGFEKRKVTDLSGGEQQRVALARALAPQPRLLMFDEPLGALDRTLKEDLLNEIRDILHRMQIPAIYVTHDQEEAFTIADTILLLQEGRIVRTGTPEEVWSNPQLVWAAKFLNAGNVLDGLLIQAGKAQTAIGVLDISCEGEVGEKVSLLVRQSSDGEGQEVKLKVEAVLFKREQFQVKVGGGIFIQMKEKPAIGQLVSIKINVECLV